MKKKAYEGIIPQIPGLDLKTPGLDLKSDEIDLDLSVDLADLESSLASLADAKSKLSASLLSEAKSVSEELSLLQSLADVLDIEDVSTESETIQELAMETGLSEEQIVSLIDLIKQSIPEVESLLSMTSEMQADFELMKDETQMQENASVTKEASSYIINKKLN